MLDDPIDDQQPHDTEDNAERSIDTILNRLTQVENSVRKFERPWFLTPSNLISGFAVISSVGIFIFTYWSETKESQFQKMQQLAQVIDQISALSSQEAKLYQPEISPVVRTNATFAISNQRTALVNQVDRLLADVGEASVSKIDLALLAPAYASVGRLDRAEKIFKSLAQDNNEPLYIRIQAWRSLVAVYSFYGPERIPDAIKATEKGLELLESDKKNLGLEGESILLPHVLATTLATARRYEEAFKYLLIAERNASAATCSPGRSQLLQMVRTTLAAMLPFYPSGETSLENTRLEGDLPCPGDDLVVEIKSTPPSGEIAASSDFVGEYRHGQLLASVRDDSAGGIDVTVGTGPPQKLDSVSGDVFSARGAPGYYVYFHRDDSGSVARAVFLQPNGIFPASRN
jgi:tetratricopeptide (TPR) repeat protein